MNGIIRTIRSDGIARGALTLVSGAALGRAIGFLTVPLLARIYSPSDYGIAAAITAIIAVMLPFTTLRYVVALPLPRSDVVAAAVIRLCASLIVAVGAFAALVLLAAAMMGVDELLGVPSVYYWAIPLGLAIGGVREIAVLWGTRVKAYGQISRSQLFQSLSGEAVKLGLGVFGFKPLGLVLGQIIAQGSGGLLILARERTRISSAMRLVTWQRLWRVAQMYRGFPLYRLPSHFLLQLSSQAPLLIIAYLYQSATAGNFALAFTLIALPANIIGQGIGTAYYGEIAQIGRRDPRRIRALTAQTQLRLLVVSLPVAGAALLVADHLTLLLGSEWDVTERFFMMLIPMAAMQIVSVPVMQVLNVINRQELFLKINIFRTSLIALLFLGASLIPMSPAGFVMAYSAIMTGFYLCLCLLVPVVLRGHARSTAAGVQAERSNPPEIRG